MKSASSSASSVRVCLDSEVSLMTRSIHKHPSALSYLSVCGAEPCCLGRDWAFFFFFFLGTSGYLPVTEGERCSAQPSHDGVVVATTHKATVDVG